MCKIPAEASVRVQAVDSVMVLGLEREPARATVLELELEASAMVMARGRLR